MNTIPSGTLVRILEVHPDDHAPSVLKGDVVCLARDAVPTGGNYGLRGGDKGFVTVYSPTLSFCRVEVVEDEAAMLVDELWRRYGFTRERAAELLREGKP